MTQHREPVARAMLGLAEPIGCVLSDRAGHLHGAEITVDGGITATR